MASVTTPTINKIIRLNSYDLLGKKCVKYNMYMCLDTLQLWYDESDSKRTLYAYVGVDTVNDLQNNLIPESGVTYYCWESNSLWLWLNRWICIYTDGKYPSAYRADTDYIEAIYISDENPTIVDNNGLLRDGSVVIRDANRVIKGRMYVSEDLDNIVLSSFLGGGIRILPNGSFTTSGELYIDDDENSFIRSQWTVLNNEMYVDYHEKPSTDPSKYIDEETHRYKVWHEGNLRLDDLELTGLNIYNKLIEAQEDGTLPDPLDLNVDRLDGLHATDFALKNHIHSASDISDFSEAAQKNAETAIMKSLTEMIYKGARITWVEGSSKYMLSTDNFILAFTGDVTGQGTVTNNTNTTIALEVDPDKHVHQDLIDRIDAIEGMGLDDIDLSNYYNKSAVDNMFSTTPVAGKALVVNNQGTLPANAQTASDLNHDTELKLTGDITGSVTFGYDQPTLTLNTDASNIVSSTPTSGKALLLDTNGYLPTKAYSAEELDHNIQITLSGLVKGTASLDTSATTFSLVTSLDDSSLVLTPDDIGVKVASLNDDGIVPDTQLPDGILNALKLVGDWNGGSAPSSNPTEGQAWVVTTDCTFNGDDYSAGDIIYYHNYSWNKMTAGLGIREINGYTSEIVTLDYDDVNAVSDAYINYTVGATIPANKIVITDATGHIAGATVDNLTNEFSIKSNGGDVEIVSASPNTSTDGSSDLEIRLGITTTGYNNIANEIQRNIYVNSNAQSFKKNLDFIGNGITASADGTFLNVDFTAIEAAKLHTAVNINGTSFDGSADITTTKWGTARNISISDSDGTNTGTAVSVDGSAAKTLKLPSTIKASLSGNATSATKATQDGSGNTITSTYLKLSGGTMTGTITSRALTPSANNSYAIGTSSARYSTGYFTTTNTTNLTVNGKKVFIQSSTPSGASSGDIWIVTT